MGNQIIFPEHEKIKSSSLIGLTEKSITSTTEAISTSDSKVVFPESQNDETTTAAYNEKESTTIIETEPTTTTTTTTTATTATTTTTTTVETEPITIASVLTTSVTSAEGTTEITELITYSSEKDVAGTTKGQTSSSDVRTETTEESLMLEEAPEATTIEINKLTKIVSSTTDNPQEILVAEELTTVVTTSEEITTEATVEVTADMAEITTNAIAEVAVETTTDSKIEASADTAETTTHSIVAASTESEETTTDSISEVAEDMEDTTTNTVVIAASDVEEIRSSDPTPETNVIQSNSDTKQHHYSTNAPSNEKHTTRHEGVTGGEQSTTILSPIVSMLKGTTQQPAEEIIETTTSDLSVYGRSKDTTATAEITTVLEEETTVSFLTARDEKIAETTIANYVYAKSSKPQEAVTQSTSLETTSTASTTLAQESFPWPTPDLTP